MIERPALAAVLAALLDCRPGEERPEQWLAMPGCALGFGTFNWAGRPRDGARFVVPQPPNPHPLDPHGVGRDVRREWVTHDPHEAWEMLVTRDLLDESPRRAWWCTGCDGRGTGAYEDGYVEWDTGAWVGPDCSVCEGRGCIERPASIPALVAVASLAMHQVLGVEELCVRACDELASWGVGPCENITWRVGDRPEVVGLAEPIARGRDFDVGPDGATRAWLRPGDPLRVGGEIVAPAARALWDMGLALERIGSGWTVIVVPSAGKVSRG